MDGRDWMGVHFEHTWYSLARAKAGSCLPRGGFLRSSALPMAGWERLAQ